MKTKKAVILALCICAILVSLVPQITLAITNPAVTILSTPSSPKFGGTVMPYDIPGGGQHTYWVLGYQFLVNQDIFVSQLGIYDWHSDGLFNSHQIGLWKDDGTLLDSVSFSPGSGTLYDYFQYLSINTITLFSGQKYRIGATYVDNDIDDRIDFDTSPFTLHIYDPTISWLITADQDNQTGSVLEFPTKLEYWYVAGEPQTPASLLGPNFQFEPVPEPTTMLLLGSGLVGLWGCRRKFRK